MKPGFSETLPRGARRLSPLRAGDGINEVEPGAIVTLVLWLTCAAVGVLGLVLHYPRPVEAPPAIPLQARLVHVDIVELPAPVPEPPASEPGAPPALVPARPEAPRLPALVPMAAPPANVAFALPAALPSTVLATTQAARIEPRALRAATASPAPAAEPLTLGQGAGKQPLPEYPRAAVRDGQEGTVRIGLLVGEDGRVVSAEVVAPSPWPRLNEAALRVVRQRWRFAPGSLRRYEAPIQFQLQK